jgi:hypothetical protein
MDLDLDGVLDGVRTDLDGDGLFDDAVGDADGDGMGDYAVLDADDDAMPEARFTDDGTGTWIVSGGAPSGPLRWIALDGTEHTGGGDIDGDGVTDRFVDTDRDGRADRALQAGVDGSIRAGYIDTDRDGRWDVTLTDTDGDGSADGASPFRP